MRVCQLADGRRRLQRCAAVRRASTDRTTPQRGRHRSSSRPQVCGSRCSRAMWAESRRVAARAVNSRRAARATCSVQARGRRRLARVETPIAALAMPPRPARIVADSIHRQQMEIEAASIHPLTETGVGSIRPRRVGIGPKDRRCRVRVAAQMHRQEWETPAGSVPSRRLRAARPRVANPILTLRAVAVRALAGATTGTARRRVPRSHAVTVGMAVTQMA